MFLIRLGNVNRANLNIRKSPSTSASRWNGLWPQNHIALITSYSPGWYQTLYRRAGIRVGSLSFSSRFIRKLFFRHMYISTVPKDRTTRQQAHKTVAGGVVTEYTLNGKNIVHLKKGTDGIRFPTARRASLRSYGSMDCFYCDNCSISDKLCGNKRISISSN